MTASIPVAWFPVAASTRAASSPVPAWHLAVRFLGTAWNPTACFLVAVIPTACFLGTASIPTARSPARASRPAARCLPVAQYPEAYPRVPLPVRSLADRNSAAPFAQDVLMAAAVRPAAVARRVRCRTARHPDLRTAGTRPTPPSRACRARRSRPAAAVGDSRADPAAPRGVRRLRAREGRQLMRGAGEAVCRSCHRPFHSTGLRCGAEQLTMRKPDGCNRVKQRPPVP